MLACALYMTVKNAHTNVLQRQKDMWLLQDSGKSLAFRFYYRYQAYPAANDWPKLL